MILTRLQIENFLPFRGNQSIDLSPTGGRPVVVVFAPNGRGKTSILNAIRWALYGRAYKRSSKEIGLSELINREALENGEFDFGVTLEFEVGVDKYRLVRRAMPRQLVSRPRKDSDYQEHVSMHKNGIALPGDQVLHEINQVAPEQISRFFLFDGELLDQYEALLIEGSDQGRLIREAIERVLGVPALVRAREDLRLLERTAMREHARDESQMKGMAEQQTRLTELLDEADRLDRECAVYKEQIDKFQVQVDSLESQLEGAERALKDQADYDAIERAICESAEQMRDTESQIREARALLWEDLLARAIHPFEGQLNKESERLIASVSMRDALKAEMDELTKYLEVGLCATCQQTLPIESKAKVQQQFDDLGRKLAQVATDPRRLREVMGKLQQVSQIRENGSIRSLNLLEAQRTKLTRRQIELENERDRLREELEGLDTESMKTTRTRLRTIESEKRDLERQFATALAESEQRQRQAVALQKAMEASSTSDRYAASRLRRNFLATLLLIVENSIEELRSRLRSEVEEHATSAFRKMTTQSQYERLEINESYGLKILDAHSRETPLRSAGVEQVVALSLIDGLHKTGMGSGGVVMDTPFGRLDPSHRMNIITHLATSSPQVVMLVHEGEVSKEFVIEHLAEEVARTYELEEVGVLLTQIRPVALGVEL